MSRMHRTLIVALALATCSGSMLAACGDDDDTADPITTTVAPADDSTTDASSDTTTAPGGKATDAAAFCEPYLTTTIMMSGEPDPEVLAESVKQIDANAPEEIAESAAVMTAAVRAVLDSGGEDFSPMETPEFTEARAEVDPYAFENCEFDTSLEVKGVDFAFADLPTTIDAGRVGILFTNEGKEAHEIALMRRNDGVTESFEELLSLPEEQAMEKVTPVGGTFAPTTGSKGLLVGDLEPGDYLATCFVPTGTTMADGVMTDGTGKPHFMQGMQQEFTVTA